MFDQLLLHLNELVGFAAFAAILVNVLKYFAVIKDGDATKVVAGINLLGLVLLFVAQVFFPDLDIGVIDAGLGAIANIVGLVMGFLLQMGVSKLSHAAVKSVPVIGFSYSENK